MAVGTAHGWQWGLFKDGSGDCSHMAVATIHRWPVGMAVGEFTDGSGDCSRMACGLGSFIPLRVVDFKKDGPWLPEAGYDAEAEQSICHGAGISVVAVGTAPDKACAICLQQLFQGARDQSEG